MIAIRKATLVLTLAVLSVPFVSWGQAPPAAAPASISLGTVKSIAGDSIAITTDAGTELNVTVAAGAKILRTAPGRKDLQGATAIQLTDIQAGDRMLARGKLAEDGKTVLASSVIVMKHEDIAQKQQADEEAWRTRGIAGVVKSVDPAAQTITVSTGGLAAKNILVHVAKTTTLRRYAPDSVKFDDAKPGTFADVKPGDQLRARGDKNADGSEITADEIVSGTFRNIAGTVSSTNAADNTVTIADLLSKKPVTIKINSDSQMHKLPQMMAYGIAARLKGTSSAGAAGQHPAEGAAQGQAPAQSGQGQGGWQRSGQGGAGGNRPPSAGRDFQQMLSMMPPVTIADLQKGDAVILVATQGSATSQPTAITLLTGVEPILTAAPEAGMMLSPWSLGAPSGDAGP